MKTGKLSAGMMAAVCVAALGCTANRNDGMPQRRAVAPEEPSSFDTAQLLAKRDEANPESGPWRRESIGSFAGTIFPLLEPCAKGISLMDIPTVNVVVRLSAQGKATRVFTAENSAYAICVREQLQRLDMKSAPWGGYWFEVALKGPVESAQNPNQLLSYSEEPCKPVMNSTTTEPSVALGKVSPSSGSTVNPRTAITIPISYNLPPNPEPQYKLMAIFESSTPGRGLGIGITDFPYAASCGPAGSLSVKMSLLVYWNMPRLANPLKFRLAIVDGTAPIAVSDVIEYQKE
jgi:hypothetical protein